MTSEGLWISPGGREWVPVVEHLIAIQQSPESFGLGIRDVKNRTIEALRKLAENLIRDGWIRYRYLSGDHLFEMYKMDILVVDDVLGHAMIPVELQNDERVIIETVKPKKEFKGTVTGWFDRTLLRSWESNPKRAWRLSR